MANPNIELLTAIANAMGALRDQVVFVGGCATGLLITKPLVADARATEDVGAIVEVASLVGYHALAGQLVDQGFKQTMADNTPPFRWYWQGMQLNLVPVDEKVLGFANRWYKAGFGAAVTATLPSGLQLRHLSAPYFMATKLEAFNDRGNNDVYLSHDLEDVITVVDGREELVNELAAAPADVRDFVSKTLRGILQRTDFINALPGIVSQSTRTGLVLQRFTQMSEL